MLLPMWPPLPHTHRLSVYPSLCVFVCVFSIVIPWTWTWTRPEHRQPESQTASSFSTACKMVHAVFPLFGPPLNALICQNNGSNGRLLLLLAMVMVLHYWADEFFESTTLENKCNGNNSNASVGHNLLANLQVNPTSDYHNLSLLKSITNFISLTFCLSQECSVTFNNNGNSCINYVEKVITTEIAWQSMGQPTICGPQAGP